jgi:hypothetical protein
LYLLLDILQERAIMKTRFGKQTILLASASIAIAFVAVAVTTAAARNLEGRLVLGAYKPPPAPQVRPSYYWELENGVKEVTRDRVDAPRELAVVLVGGDASDGSQRVEIEFFGGSLLPSTVVVKKGSTLRIHNKDEIAHELYAKGLKGFGPEATSPRAIRSIELSKAGSWQLFDRVVTHVRGHLHVLPNLVATAKVNPKGAFSFKDVEPGSYKLKVFHGAKVLVEKPIEIPPKKDKRRRDVALKLDPITLTTTQKKK